MHFFQIPHVDLSELRASLHGLGKRPFMKLPFAPNWLGRSVGFRINACYRRHIRQASRHVCADANPALCLLCVNIPISLSCHEILRRAMGKGPQGVHDDAADFCWSRSQSRVSVPKPMGCRCVACRVCGSKETRMFIASCTTGSYVRDKHVIFRAQYPRKWFPVGLLF